MKSQFELAAARYASELGENDPNRCILEFLLDFGVGRTQSKTWKEISSHLASCGFFVRKQSFQQGLLKRSRESDFYIGSNDHGVGCGYFLIHDHEDVNVMKNWYLKRIATELSRLNHLQEISDK